MSSPPKSSHFLNDLVKLPMGPIGSDAELQALGRAYKESVKKHRELLYRYTKEEIMELGAKIWTSLHSDDKLSRLQAEAYVSQSKLPHEQIFTLGAVTWYQNGLNQIVLGQKFAAALLATRISESELNEVRPPWPSFFLVPPDKMLYVHTDEGKESAVTGILVLYEPALNKWSYIAITDSSATLWRHGCSAAQLSQEDLDKTYDSEPFSDTLSKLDDRTSSAVGRLILHSCLAYSDPANIQSRPPAENSKSGKKRGSPEPRIRTYVFGRPTIVDCREAVQTYLRTGKKGRGLTVQTLVAGHYKPKLGQRLGHSVWVHPYWRGDEDAPILARTLQMEKD